MKNLKAVLIVLACIAGVALSLLIVSTIYKVASNSSTLGSSEKSFVNKKFNVNLGSGNIAILDIDGEITSDTSQTYNNSWLLDQLDKITNDTSNKGLLLAIDSPGGGIYETDEVYLKLLDYKKTGRPIYTSMGSMAASGGYYLSSASTKIFANRNTLTGSIGVRFGTIIDLTGFLGKYGIKVRNITSGKNKAMGDYFEPMTQEQIDIMQSISDEAYDQFVGVVATGRGLTTDYVKSLADGRVYTAKQALKNKLIDNIGNLDDTMAAMKSIKGLENAEFITYHYTKKPTLMDMFNISASNNKPELNGELDSALSLIDNPIRRPSYYCEIGN